MENPLQNLRVLILEDESEVAFLLSSVLEFNQFNVKVVDRALLAIEELKNNAFDLFISDDRMEGMTGIEAIHEVRNTLKLDKLRIILLTFRELTDGELAVISRENVTYLRKPFLPNEILQRIEESFA